MRTATALLSILTVALLASACRKDSPLPPSGLTQAETTTESQVWPCIDRPRTEHSADAAMLQRVRKLGISPDIQNMTQANAAAARKALPAVTALQAFFGDPQMPSVPSMADFSDLADDPRAQKTLGEAFALLDHRDDARAAAVVRTMTQTEQSYFDTVSNTLGALGSNGGADVGRFEVPRIGTLTAPDSRSYLKLMLEESERLRVALDGMPDNHRAVWWLEYRTNRVIDKLNAGCEK